MLEDVSVQLKLQVCTEVCLRSVIFCYTVLHHRQLSPVKCRKSTAQ